VNRKYSPCGDDSNAADDGHLHAAPNHPGGVPLRSGSKTAAGLPAVDPGSAEYFLTQLLNIPVSYAQEGLRAAQFPIEGYDELSVEEALGRLGGLSAEELRVVSDYEERNKKRDTLLEQLDRKIRGDS
jgi:hypothetical protein